MGNLGGKGEVTHCSGTIGKGHLGDTFGNGGENEVGRRGRRQGL